MVPHLNEPNRVSTGGQLSRRSSQGGNNLVDVKDNFGLQVDMR